MLEPYESAKISKQLPYEIRSALVKAAQVDLIPGDLLARAKAIERVVSRAKSSHPYLFV